MTRARRAKLKAKPRAKLKAKPRAKLKAKPRAKPSPRGERKETAAKPSPGLIGPELDRELGHLGMVAALDTAFEDAGFERTPAGFRLKSGDSELEGTTKSDDGWCEWRIVCKKGVREVVLDGECGGLHAWVVLGILAKSAPALLELD